jgi:hypothetical protein
VPRPAVSLPASLTPSDPDYARERYTVPQAALYLCVSVDRVYDEAARGRLAHRRHQARHGARLLFAQADLDAWRQSGRVEVRGASTPRVPAVDRRPSDEPVLQFSGTRRIL